MGNAIIRLFRVITPTTGFDVFINHRGSDVKEEEASLLYHHLQYKGLKVFLDKYSIQVGDKIPESIEHAVRTASVHIAIFSPNYAESEWCLNELVLMFETGAPIIPLFCGVSPSEVCMEEDNGSYALAFRKHKESAKVNPETLQKWQESLCQASNIKGIVFTRNKGELVEQIAKCVSLHIDKAKTMKRPMPCPLRSKM